ncbi:MAG: DUF4130 domain-containing protein [Burkholderiales bacterium]|nr:MAG: DUF4130 domain-containing protein [Burkholderiales bacterium]
MRARLSGETDIDGFRAEARGLLARNVPPAEVHWDTAGNSDLFAAADEERPAPPPTVSAAMPPAATNVPAPFLQLCREVILHNDPNRFALLYRLLWRLTHEPGLRHDPLDPDMLKAQGMAQAVRRDMHKMKAFVRFRTVPGDPLPDVGEAVAEPDLHVAWFEPGHHIVEAVAPWFARRFANMRWAILTPERCVSWDGKALTFKPGASKADAPPADAGEALWLTYYQHIFNPARLKLKMMQKEMPRKYWHNLPEARFIAPLAAQAHERSGMMIASEPPAPNRRIPVLAAEPQPELMTSNIQSLRALKEATMRCRECPIGEYATQSVTGAGPLSARIMFVGEQPGDQEDLRGEAFVGPAGQLLNRALDELGIDRADTFVTNAVKHFKFELRGKRRIHKTPSQREAAACKHWLEDEIRLVKPAALVALGATAARSLMGHAVGVTSERGRWLTRDDGRQVLITLHPSALLRMPEEDKAQAYAAFLADLQKVTPLLRG